MQQNNIYIYTHITHVYCQVPDFFGKSGGPEESSKPSDPSPTWVTVLSSSVVPVSLFFSSGFPDKVTNSQKKVPLL